MSVIQSNHGRSAGSQASHGVAFPGSTVAGHLQIVFAFANEPGVLTTSHISDTLTSTWQRDREVTRGGSFCIAVFSALVPSGGGANTITITPASSADIALVIIEQDGNPGSAWVSGDTEGAVSTDTAIVSGTIASAADNGRVFAGFAHSSGPSTITPGGGWTEIGANDDTTGGVPYSVLHQASTASSSYTGTWTGSNAVDFIGAIVNFKETAGGGGATRAPMLALLGVG